MGAIMNGFAYFGLFRISGATFLVFADYLRASIRLAALSEATAKLMYMYVCGINNILLIIHACTLSFLWDTFSHMTQLLLERMVLLISLWRPCLDCV